MPNFTPEQLIAFHYGELSPAKTTEIQEALSQSWPLQEKYKVITEATNLLDKGMKSPGWRSLQSVLSHLQPSFNCELMDN